jgi:hypothetical protein
VTYRVISIVRPCDPLIHPELPIVSHPDPSFPLSPNCGISPFSKIGDISNGNPFVFASAATELEVTVADAIGQRVMWKENSLLAGQAERPVRLRFELRDADVFAFHFSEEQPATGN